MIKNFKDDFYNTHSDSTNKNNEDSNELECKSNKSESTKSSKKILNPPLKFVKLLKTASSFWSEKFCFKK